MSSVQPISLSFFLLMAAEWVLAVINVWLFVESHPECCYRETPRSQRGACRVTPQLLMHTSRYGRSTITASLRFQRDWLIAPPK